MAASSPVETTTSHTRRTGVQEQLNQMTEDRVSRMLDLSGGDRVIGRSWCST